MKPAAASIPASIPDTMPWFTALQAQARLAQLQAEWSTAQWLQFTGQCERGLALALDAQRAWLHQLEVGTASVLAAGAPQAVPDPQAPAGRTVFELMEQPDPSTLMRDAQQAWRDIGAAWLGAMKHDLREEAAAP